MSHMQSKAEQASANSLITRLLKEISGLKEDRDKWQKEALQQYPTPEAYQAVCDALNRHRAGVRELIKKYKDRKIGNDCPVFNDLQKLIDEAKNHE